MASHASSVTLCAQSSATQSAASTEGRLAAVEKMLASQQVMLERLLSALEPRFSLARTPEDIYEHPPSTPDVVHEPTPDLTPEEIYERARAKAGFSDQHEWNAAYIQGLIRIDGERSKSIIMEPACPPCVNTRNLAVCVSLAENDPYCGALIYEKGVCCSWCEYEKVQGEEDERPNKNGHRTISPLDTNEDQKRKEEQKKLSARQSVFFISGEGLDREVITSQIPRYLGSDALVRPGTQHVCLPVVSRTIITDHSTESYDIQVHRRIFHHSTPASHICKIPRKPTQYPYH